MILTTERLVLRDFRVTDADAAHAYRSDPEATRYVSWGPNTRVETEAAVLRAVEAGGPTQLAVCLRDTGELIGAVVAMEVAHGDAEPGAVEIGWVLRRDTWGRGLASEAARALVAEVWRDPRVTSVVAFCHADNVASQRIMAGLGMRPRAAARPDDGDGNGDPNSAVAYAMTREEAARRSLA